MASRYSELRLYLAGGTVALFMAAWAALAVQDHQPSQPAPAMEQTIVGEIGIGGSSPQASAPQPVSPSKKVVPQTRTKGS